MVRKDRCYSLERWKTPRLAHMLRQTQTLEFDDLDTPEGNEVVRPKMKRLVEFDVLRGVLFTARVNADASPQLIGPLHRDRFRSNESELIRSGCSSIQKRGHLHCP